VLQAMRKTKGSWLHPEQPIKRERIFVTSGHRLPRCLVKKKSVISDFFRGDNTSAGFILFLSNCLVKISTRKREKIRVVLAEP
jgi:hypothetical protein